MKQEKVMMEVLSIFIKIYSHWKNYCNLIFQSE